MASRSQSFSPKGMVNTGLTFNIQATLLDSENENIEPHGLVQHNGVLMENILKDEALRLSFVLREVLSFDQPIKLAHCYEVVAQSRNLPNWDAACAAVKSDSIPVLPDATILKLLVRAIESRFERKLTSEQAQRVFDLGVKGEKPTYPVATSKYLSLGHSTQSKVLLSLDTGSEAGGIYIFGGDKESRTSLRTSLMVQIQNDGLVVVGSDKTHQYDFSLLENFNQKKVGDLKVDVAGSLFGAMALSSDGASLARLVLADEPGASGEIAVWGKVSSDLMSMRASSRSFMPLFLFASAPCASCAPGFLEATKASASRGVVMVVDIDLGACAQGSAEMFSRLPQESVVKIFLKTKTRDELVLLQAIHSLSDAQASMLEGLDDGCCLVQFDDKSLVEIKLVEYHLLMPINVNGVKVRRARYGRRGHIELVGQEGGVAKVTHSSASTPHLIGVDETSGLVFMTASPVH